MRKLILLFCAILISSVSNADNPTKKPPILGDIPIDPNPTIPRPLSLNADIEASYYDGVLTFVINRDLGNADIIVTNTTTGESWCGGVNGVGSTVITLSGDEGYYIIYIYTDYDEYYGEFII